MLATRPPHHRRPLGQPLLDDWSRLATRDRELDPALVASGFSPGASRTDPDAVPGAGADGVLAALVRRAASDPVAARIVLQRILPGLCAIARRRGRGHRGRTHEALDELLAAGWIVIRLFPVDRRRGFVAANLLRDIEYQAFTAHRRRAMSWREVADGRWTSDRGADEPRQRSPFDEVVDVLAAGREAGVGPEDVRFAARLASGCTIADLAAARHVTRRAVRYRRARVVAALRVAALGWGDDDAAC